MALFFYQFTPLYGHNPRSADSDAAVEHFFNFKDFCSTLGAARGGFRCGSRQNSAGKSVFCLLWRMRALDLTEEGAFRLQISGCSERGTAINKKARQTSDSLKIIF